MLCVRCLTLGCVAGVQIVPEPHSKGCEMGGQQLRASEVAAEALPKPSAVRRSMPLLHRTVSRVAKLLPRSMQLGLYKVPVLSGAIRWVLRRGTVNRSVLVTVVSGPLAGMKLYVNLRSEKHYWLGTYEPDVQAVACEEITEGDVVYDVGAHRGFFSILFSTLVGRGGEVHCFEPLPENMEILRKQLRANALEAVTKAVPAAVASRTGTATFSIGSSSSTGGLSGGGIDGEGIRVRVISVDDYVAQGNRPPDLVKMDIEGEETDAIGGMSETLRRHKPKLIIEFHSEEAKRSIWEVLAGMGYECFLISRELRACPDPLKTEDQHFFFTVCDPRAPTWSKMPNRTLLNAGQMAL